VDYLVISVVALLVSGVTLEEAADAPAAGEDEGLQRLQVLLALVDQLLERRHLGGADSEHALVGGVGRRGQLAAQVEELVLESSEHAVQPGGGIALLPPLGGEDAGQPDDGVQLVDGAVGLDPRGVLGDAAAADQRGVTLVAGPRVDPGDPDCHGRCPPAHTLPQERQRRTCGRSPMLHWGTWRAGRPT
jgi:hypothetical protein